MEADDRHDIVEVKIFLNGKSQEIREFSQVYGKSKKPNFYMGTAMVAARQRAPNGQEIVKNVPLEFPFPEGTSLKKAFDTFEDEAKKRCDEFIKRQKEHEAQSRVTPVGGPRGIVGADGRVIGG